MVLSGWFLVALLAVAPRAHRQDGTAESPPRVVRYYSLDGEVDAGELHRLLRDASVGDAEYTLVHGPVQAPPRPKQSFVAVDAPAETDPRALVKLLKKSCDGVEALVWTEFEGGAPELPAILGQPPRDCIIGMASEMRWFEQQGDRKLFFHLAGKLDAEEIASRFHRLFEPFRAGEIGTPVTETFHLALANPVDPARVERATKAIRKLSGVERAVIEGNELVLSIVLASQATSGPGTSSAETPGALPAPCLDRGPVLAILEKEGVGLGRP